MLIASVLGKGITFGLLEYCESYPVVARYIIISF